MEFLLHTIALEPARWTPARVSAPLADLLPAIAQADFRHLEIYEPHLALAPDETHLAAELTRHRLTPVILSSYLDLSPAQNPDAAFLPQADALLARVRRFGFRKVRLFPGRTPAPAEIPSTIFASAARLDALAARCPEVDFLLETHDGSLADDPARVLAVVQNCTQPNVGLLWQPTVFAADAACAQFSLQLPRIRHIHLQNRWPDGSFASLVSGVIPWAELLRSLPASVGVSLEFVPGGICPVASFDLAKVLQEAVAERESILHS